MREQEIEKKKLKRKRIEEKTEIKKESNKCSFMENKLCGFVRKEEFLFHLSAHVYYLKKFYTKMSTRESPVTVMNKEHIPVEKK